MVNEYLFLSDEYKESIEKYIPDNIDFEILNIENTSLWIAKYSIPNQNEECAKKLSVVHEEVIKYSPLVLSCESAEYYNKTLFPMVNELERKLRKLLYLAASMSNDANAKESVKKLEEKDFGEIFDLLFIDSNFITSMKSRINADKSSPFNGRSRYSKLEIELYLNNLSEEVLWDKILSSGTMSRNWTKKIKNSNSYR